MSKAPMVINLVLIGLVHAGLVLGAGAARAQELPLGDPMRPYRVESTPGTERSAPDRLELSAVLISTTRRIAVINGNFYREGDQVAGARITRIEPGSVRLRRGGEDVVVPLIREGARASNHQGDPAS